MSPTGLIRPALVVSLALSGIAVPPVFAQSGPPVLVPTIVATAPSPVPGTMLVEQDTMVRLMVLNEVTTKTAHPGDRFELLVDEDVAVGGVKIIPTGSKAWGEVVSASESGAVGKAGRLSARLLYIEAPAGRVTIRGESSGKGPGGAGATVLGVIGLGVFGLFTRGTNAKLKAGENFNGYTARPVVYDPRSATLRELGDPPVVSTPSSPN